MTSEAIHAPQNGVLSPDALREQELEARFQKDRLAELCNDYLHSGVEGVDLTDKINGRNFVVAYIPAESKYADIGRSVEYEVFAKTFHASLSEIDNDYGKYDAASVFACVIDVSGDSPVPAGVLRIIDYKEGLGFTDLNDLVEDNPDNPWIDNIKNSYFLPGETYSPAEAWKRLGERVGVDLKPEETLDIATHASADGYNGQHGAINGVSMLFYHACLRYAQAEGKKNLIAIFDIPPFENLQQFGSPFDTYEDLPDRPYGGPYPTRPAFCVLKDGVERIMQHDELVGKIFKEGLTLDELALLPNEYLAETFSNQAIGISSTD